MCKHRFISPYCHRYVGSVFGDYHTMVSADSIPVRALSIAFGIESYESTSPKSTLVRNCLFAREATRNKSLKASMVWNIGSE